MYGATPITGTVTPTPTVTTASRRPLALAAALCGLLTLLALSRLVGEGYRWLAEERLARRPDSAVAAQALQLAARLLPRDARVREALARSAAARGDLDQALAWSEAALQRSPADPWLWQQQARLRLARIERSAAAEQAVRQAMTRARTVPPLQLQSVRTAVAYWNLASPSQREALQQALRLAAAEQTLAVKRLLVRENRARYVCGHPQIELGLPGWCALVPIAEQRCRAGADATTRQRCQAQGFDAWLRRP
ncbi:MAG TPA: tetratricopeptide repeat protein [Nevskiaceae bacterium]|nr:tetratricopeptide repeat protein [Nevskiaceae bacterium]